MNTTSFPYDRACPGVLDLQPYQPGKPVEELERELGVANAIKLASNENPLGASPLALAALREAEKAVPWYPDANGFELKQVLARQHGVEPEQITLGNGSNDVLDLLARVFVAPGKRVVYSQYAFLVYELVTRAVGGQAVVTPARDWGHDPVALAAAVNRDTKLVFVANPNNPTGTYLTEEALTGLLARIPPEVVVVLDEAYCEYVTAPDYPDGLALLARHPNLVVTRTFSKIHGLAGLRIGYALAHGALAELLNRVRQPFNVNASAQAAALASLQDEDHVLRSRANNTLQLQKLCALCERLGLEYIPSVANFLTVRFGSSAQTVYQQLLRKGIIVRPVANYGMPQHLRITIGRAREMEKLAVALQSVLETDGDA